jgi:hypothetical protein
MEPQLVDCPACKVKISNFANSCIHCGHPMKQTQLPKNIALAMPYIKAAFPVVVALVFNHLGVDVSSIPIPNQTDTHQS